MNGQGARRNCTKNGGRSRGMGKNGAVFPGDTLAIDPQQSKFLSPNGALR